MSALLAGSVAVLIGMLDGDKAGYVIGAGLITFLVSFVALFPFYRWVMRTPSPSEYDRVLARLSNEIKQLRGKVGQTTDVLEEVKQEWVKVRLALGQCPFYPFG